jgi:hypothetical protein
VRASYSLHQTFFILWRWTVEVDGKPLKSGIALSKAAGRWSARKVVRGLRGRLQQTDGERVSECGHAIPNGLRGTNGA